MKLELRLSLSLLAMALGVFGLASGLGLPAGPTGVLVLLLYLGLLLIVYLTVLRPWGKLRSATEALGRGEKIEPGLKGEFGRMFSQLSEQQQKLQALGPRPAAGEAAASVEARLKLLREARDNVSRGYFQIEREKSRLTSAINGLPWGLLVTDAEFNNVVANGALATILGPPPLGGEWALPQLAERFRPGLDLEAEVKGVLQASQPFEAKALEDKEKFLRLLIEPLVGYLDPAHPSVVTGVAIVVEDVTRPRQLERTRDEFFSIASHELRTPLTAIRGNTALIRQYFADKFKDRNLQDMLSDMYESSVRLIKIVNDFLNASRLEEKKMVFKKEAFDLKRLASECIEQLENLASAKKLTLTLEAGADSSLTVVADRDRTKEVLVNLIDNAIKYTERGGVTVNLTPEPGRVSVRVIDTGLGIPAEVQAKLFRKFQQVGAGLSQDVTRSTGMGLYIAKLLVEAMAGTIRLERSAGGQGSTFLFTLPTGERAKK